MPSKSKTKGNSNEYDVRDRLTEWYGKPFVKAPNSGALRWNGILWTYGDLIPPEDFHFCCEAKHYAEVGFDDILGRRTNKSKTNPDPQPSFGTGLVSDWWFGQALIDAERATRELGKPIEALLFWKQDHHRQRICLRSILYQNIEASIRKTLVCCWIYVPSKEPFIMLDLDLFLSKVTPQELLAAHEKLCKISANRT